MSGTDPSSPIDFTTSDSEDSYSAASDIESQSSLKASLKRSLSDSPMEDMIDHDQLQASIENDVLGGIRVHPSWSFGRISTLDILPQPKSMTPSFSQDSGTTSTKSSPASLDNEFIFSNKLARTGATRQELRVSRASYSDQPNTEDLDMMDAEPLDFSQRLAKRIRSNQPSTSSKRTTLTDGQGLAKQTLLSLIIPQHNELELSQNDYLDDEGLEAFLRSTVPSTSEIDTQTELLPDTEREIIELEEDEAAEAAEEIEDETSNEYMKAVAVDETNEELMNIVEIYSDDADHTARERRKPQTQSRPQGRPLSIPNDGLGLNNLRLNEIRHGSHTYKVGHGVEFYNGTFMRIKSIYRGHRGQVLFSGPLLTRHLHHFLDPKDPVHTRLIPTSGRQNELIWTVTIDELPRRKKDFVSRELSDAMRPREIILTNQTWPCISSQGNTGGYKRGTPTFYGQGKLFCRWKRVKQLSVKKAHQDYEESLERLAEEEADAEHSIKASKLRFAWRRQHVNSDGGSATFIQQFVAVDGSTQTEKVVQYTFADCFCGCGGASRGAELAGLAIKWAIDSDEKAARSYRATFKSATCYQEEISDLLSRLGEPGATAAYMIDVLHMSPPCQAFSLARTGGSEKEKELLQAPITSVGDILGGVKPRIATMEETAGLYYAHKDWMARVIRDITGAGYGVRWKIMESQTMGVPQVRKRVVIIAAGPGEVLPPFPKPTHGPASRLQRRLATIHDAISGIPPRATHNQLISKFKKGTTNLAFSPHTQAKTVTCGVGKGNYHPSGLRPYTVREVACLQTFPFLHSFANANLTTAKKQIGNAYPPVMARAVFRAVIQSLKEADGVQ
jgi:DNA (cytosine-5)-methyltransferase 1